MLKQFLGYKIGYKAAEIRKGLTKGLNKASSEKKSLHVAKDKAFMDENQTYQYSISTLTAVAIILERSFRAERSRFLDDDLTQSQNKS